MKLCDVVRTCIACPSQWDAMTEDNHSVYIRYRWGNISMLVCPEIGKREYTGSDGYGVWVTILDEQTDDDLDGFMNDEEMMAIADKIKYP